MVYSVKEKQELSVLIGKHIFPFYTHKEIINNNKPYWHGFGPIFMCFEVERHCLFSTIEKALEALKLKIPRGKNKGYWIRKENIDNQKLLFAKLDKKYRKSTKYFISKNWDIIITVPKAKIYILAKYQDAYTDGYWNKTPKFSWLSIRKEIKSQEEFINLL